MAHAVVTSFQSLIDTNGVPLNNARIFVLDAGTSNLKTIYSDDALGVTASNPITTNSRGRHAIRYVAAGTYKIQTETGGTDTLGSGTTVTDYCWDNIDTGVAVGSGALPIASGGTAATTAGAARTNLDVPSNATVTSISTDLSTLSTEVDQLIWGQCRLTKSGGNLLLSPYKGNKLTINSVAQTIPDAGVTLAPGSVPSGTLEYIYAYMSSGTMTLEYSTTAYATQAGTGVTIKSGDATRTLVGMAYAAAGPLWVDSVTQRFVRSWFNDPGIALLNSFSTDRTTTSTSYAEVNSEIRVEFLVWSGETISLNVVGSHNNNNSGDWVATSIGIDGTTAEDSYAITTSSGATNDSTAAASAVRNSLSEGYHYATLLGKVNANTGKWRGSGTAGTRTTLKGFNQR